MKSTLGLTRYMNTCTSQQIFPIYMQLKQNIPILGEDDNISENFGLHEDKEFILEEQDIKGDHRNLVDKSSGTGSYVRDSLSRYTPQDRLLASESLLSLREVKFSKQEFSVGKPVSDIKYHHPSFQSNNTFHSFNNQLDYVLTTYFAESEMTKGNVNRFLSSLLMALLTKKLSYQNADKWIKKLANILQGIPNDKWIDHKFELQSGVGGIAGREISTHLQNMIRGLEFLMHHPNFRHDQTYELSHVFNENEYQVSNKMYTGEW